MKYIPSHDLGPTLHLLVPRSSLKFESLLRNKKRRKVGWKSPEPPGRRVYGKRANLNIKFRCTLVHGVVAGLLCLDNWKLGKEGLSWAESAGGPQWEKLNFIWSKYFCFIYIV